jgi:hypothetical protein
MERVGKRTCMYIGPSVLNLRRWIPQKDVIRLILKRLNKADWELVWAAHNKEYEEKLVRDRGFRKACARYGYLELVVWKNPAPNIDYFIDILKETLKYGQTHVLEWVLKTSQSLHKCWFNSRAEDLLLKKAAKHGNIAALQLWNEYFVKRIGRCGTGLYHIAAEHGHLNVLQWMVLNGYTLSYGIERAAAENGHLHILKWMKKNGYIDFDLDRLDYITLPDVKNWIRKQRNKQINI